MNSSTYALLALLVSAAAAVVNSEHNIGNYLHRLTTKRSFFLLISLSSFSFAATIPMAVTDASRAEAVDVMVQMDRGAPTLYSNDTTARTLDKPWSLF